MKLQFSSSSLMVVDLDWHITDPLHDITNNWRNVLRRLSVNAIRIYLDSMAIEEKSTDDWLSILRSILDFPQPPRTTVHFDGATEAMSMLQIHATGLRPILPAEFITWESFDRELNCYKQLSLFVRGKHYPHQCLWLTLMPTPGQRVWRASL